MGMEEHYKNMINQYENILSELGWFKKSSRERLLEFVWNGYNNETN